jgi:hypothetical protein
LAVAYGDEKEPDAGKAPEGDLIRTLAERVTRDCFKAGLIGTE